ncbi:MAG: hypothetical protein ACI8R4_000411 [Paracoccaceae bacterium]|jgi:hypothetical protein
MTIPEVNVSFGGDLCHQMRSLGAICDCGALIAILSCPEARGICPGNRVQTENEA